MLNVIMTCVKNALAHETTVIANWQLSTQSVAWFVSGILTFAVLIIWTVAEGPENNKF